MSKLLKKAGRAVGKVFKGVGKVVKKVVSGIVKFGKKVVKGVGKVMGKLGPIGTLAVGIIAPYALGAIAGAGMGWVSTAAQKALEFGSLVKSAVAAPFKALGQVAGKGISALGQSVGGKFAGITETLASKLGYTGGSVSEGIKNVFGEVGAKWDTLMTPTSNVPSFGDVGVDLTKAPKDVSFDPNAGNVDLLDPKAVVTSPADVAFGSDPNKLPSLFGDMGPKQVFDPTQADPFATESYTQGINVATDPLDAQYTLKQGEGLFDRLKKGLGSLGTGTATGSPISPTSPVGSGYDALQSAGGEQGGGQGGLGRSFSGQEHTGFMQSEEFARMMHEGLFGQRRYA